MLVIPVYVGGKSYCPPRLQVGAWLGLLVSWNSVGKRKSSSLLFARWGLVRWCSQHVGKGNLSSTFASL